MRIIAFLPLMVLACCCTAPLNKSPAQRSLPAAEVLGLSVGFASQADAVRPSRAGGAFGAWKMNPSRSTGAYSDSLLVRFESHPKGEVFTWERIETNGRTTSSSTILYFDGAPRDFQDFERSGTQSSWRRDSKTVEILRNCGSGRWTRFVRRTSIKPNELVLEVTEQRPDGHRFERRLVLEKQ